MRRLSVITLLLLTMSSCTSVPATTATPSLYTIAGTVYTCTCCLGEFSIEAVSEKGIVYRTEDGLTTFGDYNSEYSIVVPAGTYTLKPSSDGSSVCKWNSPQTVSVPPDALHVDFYYNAH